MGVDEMNDFELLQLAAKAVGFGEIEWVDIEADWDIDEFHGARFKKGGGYWNPLTDDGDALRLAVKLGMDVNVRSNRTVCDHISTQFHGDDPYAATRRAIVRAAAEIGKAMS